MAFRLALMVEWSTKGIVAVCLVSLTKLLRLESSPDIVVNCDI